MLLDIQAPRPERSLETLVFLSLERIDRSREVWHFLITGGINIYRSIWSLMDVDPVFPGSFEKQLLMEWISYRKVVFPMTAYQTYVNTDLMDDSCEKQKVQSEKYLYPESRRYTNIETQQALPLSDVEKKANLFNSLFSGGGIETQERHPRSWNELRRKRINSARSHRRDPPDWIVPSRRPTEREICRIFLPGERVAAICVGEVRAVQSPNGEANLEFGKEFWRVYWGLVDKEEESAAPPRRNGITRKQPPFHQRRKTVS